MARAASDRLRGLTNPRFCTCAEPFLDPNDDEAWCWRCRRPVEALDHDGIGLGFADDEEPPA